jgi:hypothetical protein
MTTARLKTATREVWQYAFKGTPMPPWAERYTEWRPDGLYLVRRSGKQLIEANEWLIRDLDGDPEWMTDEDFRREYELT